MRGQEVCCRDPVAVLFRNWLTAVLAHTTQTGVAGLNCLCDAVFPFLKFISPAAVNVLWAAVQRYNASR